VSEPFEPEPTVPPGAHVDELAGLRGWTAVEMAAALELSIGDAVKLLLGELPIDEALAAKLAGVLGVPVSFWLNAERHFRADEKRLDRG
jgi:plasmid maintenance system antidote protein VapI